MEHIETGETYDQYHIYARNAAEFYFLLGQAEYGGHNYLVNGNKITFEYILKSDIDEVILQSLEYLRNELKDEKSPYYYGIKYWELGE